MAHIVRPARSFNLEFFTLFDNANRKYADVYTQYSIDVRISTRTRIVPKNEKYTIRRGPYAPSKLYDKTVDQKRGGFFVYNIVYF